jgi:hypothetical protein
MTNCPKFLLSDNSEFPEHLFIVHTEYPRFVLNAFTDDVFWMEEFDEEDQEALKIESKNIFENAFEFYDREINKI